MALIKHHILVAQIPDLLADPDMGPLRLIGDQGGHSAITGEVHKSGVVMGTLFIETEHGTVYLDPESEIEVYEDDAKTHTPRSANPYAIQSFDQLRVIYPDVENALANKQTMLHFNLAPRRGGWTQTFTGQQFWPMDPRPEEVHLEDIAHALANLCRYNGHTRTHYSVAEHCVHLSYAVSAEHALWALLHDATEAYVGDMVRPLKRHMPEYSAVEDHLMTVIAERFGLPGTQMPDEVAHADSRIIIDEKASLLGPEPADWGLPFPPLGVKIHAWDALTAEAAYLARFDELTT